MASYQEEPSDAKAFASAEPIPPNPGLLTFRKLAINKGQITRVEEKKMESNIQTQDKILCSKIYSEQFCNAARNVKGVMLYHSYKKSEAIKIWQEILASDKTNLNALQDITLAYQKLRYNLKAQEYEAQLINTKEDASPDEKRMMIARCHAEQGYALSQDLHTQSWKGINLRQEQVNCYKNALEMAKGLIGQKEKRDWLLYTGKAYETLCHASFRAGRQDLYMDSIGKAIENLHEALQMSDKNALYQAEIWLMIGNTFAQDKRWEAFVPPQVVEQCYKENWENPMICYEKALKLDPNNLWLMGRMGIYLKKQGNLNGALKWLKKCIDATDQLPPEDPQKNSSWNALCCRARIYISKAKQNGFQSKHADAHSFLKKAQLDADRALELRQSPTTLALAGQVNHMLARNPLTPLKEVDHLRKIALDRFYEGSVSQDGSTSSDVHLKWAECLQDGGDLQSAIESFKIAFDTKGTEADYHAKLASKLLNAMLRNYKDLGRPKHLFGEVAFWFIYTHKSCNGPHKYIKMLDGVYAPEILDILEYSSQHVSDESTTVREMIKTFKEVMNERYIRDKNLKMRLSNLGEKRNPSLSQRQELEPTAIQEDDVPNDRPLTLGVDFDFYILHEGNNPGIRDWIKYSLLKGLECKFFALKGYYHQRDSRLGALEHESKAKAMENSAKILIVLSHGFDGIKNVTTEIAQCLQAKNTEKVIVLQREPVEVPTKLRCYKKFDFTVQHYRHSHIVLLSGSNTLTIIWPHKRHNLDHFLAHIDQHHPSIKFTMETEQNNSIPFLDVLLTRSPSGKLANQPYYNQSLTPSADHFEHVTTALTIINKYPRHNIKTGIPASKPAANTTPEENQPAATSPKLTVVLPYIGQASHKNQRILQAADIQVRHSSSNKLHSILYSQKDKLPQRKKARVYKIPCKCGKVYIGEAGRNLETQLQEHKTSFRLSDWDKSVIIEHTQQHEHIIEWENSHLISIIKHWNTRRIREAIRNYSNNTVPQDSGLYINDIWKLLINKYTDLHPPPPTFFLQPPIHQPLPPSQHKEQPPTSQQTTVDNSATNVGDTHSISLTPHITHGQVVDLCPQPGDSSPHGHVAPPESATR
eukprot:XP_011671913.1 PREDICTED: uncharacterized protein LOC105441949 [Strongylocentrotus purpuratus]